MRDRNQTRGNSMGIRIGRPPAAGTHREQVTAIERRLVAGKIKVTRIVTKVTLEALMAGITDENCHAEVGTGPAAGDEAW